MAKHGVAGMSMRDLAAAAGCNVATIYHHFESKQALLAAVLEEARYLEVLSGPAPVVPSADPDDTLEALFAQMLGAMLGVEDFVRLMLGESLRGDPVVMEVGRELLESTGEAIRRWLAEAEGDLAAPEGGESARSGIRRARGAGAPPTTRTRGRRAGQRGLEAQEHLEAAARVARAALIGFFFEQLTAKYAASEARGANACSASDLIARFARDLAAVIGEH